MSDITAQTVYELLVRIENRLDTIERTLGDVKSRQDTGDGEKKALIFAIRFLGPTGLAALGWSVLKGAGYL